MYNLFPQKIIITSLFFALFVLSINSSDLNDAGKIPPGSEKLIKSLKLGYMKTAGEQLDSLIALHPQNNYLKYLHGIILINNGDDDVYRIIDELESVGNEKYSDLLKLHIDVLIGNSSAEEKLANKIEQYPDVIELHLLNWLLELDDGKFEKAKSSLIEIKEKTYFKFLPLLAAYYHSYDLNYEEALNILTRLKAESGYKFAKDSQKLAYLQNDLFSLNLDSNIVLEYQQCGAQPGILATTQSGQKLKIAFDTGTNGYGFTIHKKSLGDSLEGKIIYKVENGIQYNYMKAPADITAKLVDFAFPPVDNMLIEYFDGALTIADGVFSPLLLNAAVTINSKAQSVVVRNEKSLEKYLNSLSKKNYTSVPYKIRKGWMFLPCEVKGKEVLMMLETGSRDVNFNSLATKRLNIDTYESSIKWKGEDYPLTKLDTEIKVGDFTYIVSGGHESDFVLGNLGYGLAAAGDLGPDFISNYIFTIDPYNKQIILEKL